MQAILSPTALKPFTRALAALSKFGEDLDIYATPKYLSLTATNSSKSAFGRFRAAPEFFDKYKIEKNRGRSAGGGEDDADEVEVSGQITTKSVLSILRHKGTERSVEKCEFAIVPGRSSRDATPQASGTTTSSTAEGYASVLLIRLHCKYGVKKTHRLSLSAPPEFMSPQIPPSPIQSRVVVGPRAIKDLIDHFGNKASRTGELQLVWVWDGDEVKVRTLRGLTANSTDSQIATSITVEAEEFDLYEVPEPPIAMCFHLREFLAATALAEALSLQLNLSFSDADAPLSITIESDSHESFFVLAVRRPPESAMASDPAGANAKKRTHEEERASAPRKKAMTVVKAEPRRRDSPSLRTGSNSNASQASEPVFRVPDPPRTSQTPVPGPSQAHQQSNASSSRAASSTQQRPAARPLFYPISPSASQRQVERFDQLSQADQEVIRASGLGIEDMSADELAAMLNDDDEDMEDVVQPVPQASWHAATRTVSQAEDRHSSGQATGSATDAMMVIDDDEEVEEEDNWEEESSFIPMTQMDARVGRRRDKHFEVLDFGDD